MKILHTSDWHLGRSLYGRKRYDEFSAFLDWLVNLIEAEKVEALLVAGDIFDTGTPSNRAQKLYYAFLCRLASSCCRHVVIIGGNHDSPSFLNAPRELLRGFNIHVVGAKTDELADEVIVLYDGDRPEAIVCAVPYLRDRDIREMEAGETAADKNMRLIEGLKNHYAVVCDIAAQKLSRFESRGYSGVPLVGMGHLFTTGGKTVDGDGVRELYVGTLAHVGKDIFPPSLDYLALGHLHVPQVVAGTDYIRYSGSPVPMGFGEAKQQKKVILVDFGAGKPGIKEIALPCFQQLVSIKGTLAEIKSRLAELKEQGSLAWLEVEYSGPEIVVNLREIIEELLAGSSMELLRISNKRLVERAMGMVDREETLDSLSVDDVFIRCLDAFAVSAEEREELVAAYREIVRDLQERDVNAE